MTWTKNDEIASGILSDQFSNHRKLEDRVRQLEILVAAIMIKLKCVDELAPPTEPKADD